MTDEDAKSVELGEELYGKLRDVIVAQRELDMSANIGVLIRLLGGAIAALVPPGTSRSKVRKLVDDLRPVLLNATQDVFGEMEEMRRDGIIPGWETMQ